MHPWCSVCKHEYEYVQMYAHTWKPEDDIGHPALSLYICLRQNLPLSLELGWQPGNPSKPPFSVFPKLWGHRCEGDHAELFLWVLKPSGQCHLPWSLSCCFTGQGEVFFFHPCYSHARAPELTDWLVFHGQSLTEPEIICT